jgi:hypothetical protein
MAHLRTYNIRTKSDLVLNSDRMALAILQNSTEKGPPLKKLLMVIRWAQGDWRRVAQQICECRARDWCRSHREIGGDRRKALRRAVERLALPSPREWRASVERVAEIDGEIGAELAERVTSVQGEICGIRRRDWRKSAERLAIGEGAIGSWSEEKSAKIGHEIGELRSRDSRGGGREIGRDRRRDWAEFVKKLTAGRVRDFRRSTERSASVGRATDAAMAEILADIGEDTGQYRPRDWQVSAERLACG